jgi:CheY-like chemotaxis protein
MKLPLRIVVCDESEVIRSQIKSIARARKIDVVEVETGPRALSALMVSDALCAFVHVHLPDLSGFEVARRVRKANLRVRPELVAIAGWLTPEDISLVELVGFDRRISRPIDPVELELVLDELEARTP